MARLLEMPTDCVYKADAFSHILAKVVYPAVAGGGVLAVTDTGAANITAAPEAAPWKYTRIEGALTGGRNVIFTRDAGSPCLFFVENATTGGHDIVAKVTPGGAGVTVKPGQMKIVICSDGANLRSASALF